MKILGLHHVSIASDDIEKHRVIIENLFGVKCGPTEDNAANKVSISVIDLGNSALELVEPKGSDSPIAKFLEKRSSNIHHICLAVENIDEALKELIGKNVRMIDSKPRQGAGGSRIAFVHPESTGGILIELKELKRL
jgi:methylmalonyl-CoA epimerase